MRSPAFFLAALLGAFGCAHANEWLLPFDPAPPDELRVDHLVADGDGYLMVGRSDAGTRWVRVGSDGEVQVSAPSEWWASLSFPLDNPLVPLAAGRFVIAPVSREDQCLLRMVDSSGETLAAAEFPRELFRACGVIRVAGGQDRSSAILDGGGGLWMERPNNNFWLRVQADGELQALVPPADATASFRFSAVPDALAAYALYRAGPQMKLARMTPTQVEWTHAFPAGFEAQNVLTASDGDALVTGRHSSTNAPFVARFGPDGGVRFQTPVTAAARPSDSWWGPIARLMADDRLALVGGSGTLHGLSAVDGTLLWSLPEDGQFFQGFVSGPSVDPRQAPASLAYFVSSSTHQEIDVVSSDGSRRRIAPGGSVDPDRTAILADGSLVYVLNEGLQHIAADGSSLPVPDIKHLVPRPRKTVSVAVAASGETFLVEGVRGERFRVSEWSAEGQRLWQHSLGERPILTAPLPSRVQGAGAIQGRLAVHPDRVCVGPLWSGVFQIVGYLRFLEHNLTCLRRSDGAVLFSLPVPLSVEGQSLSPLPGIGLRDDGSVVMVMRGVADGASTGLKRVVVDAAGAVASVTALPSEGLGPQALTNFAPDGRIAVVDSLPELGLVLLVIEADGSAHRATVQQASLGLPSHIEVLGDGSVILQSWTANEFQLSRIQPSGAVAWSRRYERFPGGQPSAGGSFHFAVEQSDLVAVWQRPQDGRVRSTMEAIDIATGASRWERTLALHEDRGVLDLEIDASQRRVWVSRDRPGEILLAAHALADGAELGKRALPCLDAGACGPSSLLAADEDSLRMVGGVARLARIERDSVQTPASAGQQALLGTWYSPGTDGQGLLIDYSASSGDLLAGWFTYTGEDVYSTSGLRWFTLAGSLQADAQEAELAIYRNEGGRFAIGPITESTQVGSARLRLNRCSEAVLSYQFDAGEHAGLQGEIGLQRLTPSLFACRDQDGSVLPPAADASAGSPLRVGQSGAWYALESSGQGFLLDLRPPAEDDEGLLVGGWFTYDPAGQADDPTAQHWFLLEGSLADAVGSTLIVPIYRASGGRFDQRSTRNVHRVGDVTIDFQGCTAAALTYRFDDSDIAGGFAGREGQMALVKLLPCHQ